MSKAFICKQIRTKPDYAEPLRWSCHLLKTPSENLPRQRGRAGVGGADKDKTQHACIWTVSSSQPAFAATFRGKKEKR